MCSIPLLPSPLLPRSNTFCIFFWALTRHVDINACFYTPYDVPLYRPPPSFIVLTHHVDTTVCPSTAYWCKDDCHITPLPAALHHRSFTSAMHSTSVTTLSLAPTFTFDTPGSLRSLQVSRYLTLCPCICTAFISFTGKRPYLYLHITYTCLIPSEYVQKPRLRVPIIIHLT